jgi:biopolymer transport protein ExbD
MLSTNDFISQYETLSDEELYTIYTNKEGYSLEAQEALTIVIQKKGGLDELIHRLQEKQAYTTEVDRIGALATALARQNIDKEDLKRRISSTILSPEKVNETIQRTYTLVALDNEDRKIKPRTLVGSILATIVASAVGGIGCGIVYVFAPGIYLKIIIILLIGLILLCYGIVKLFTRQSKKNIVVLTATVVSVVLSLFLGQIVALLSIPSTFVINQPTAITLKSATSDEPPPFNRLTVIISHEDEIYAYTGTDIKSGQHYTYKTFRPFLRAKNSAGALFVLITAARTASYKNTVNMLDEMTLGKVKKYALNDATTEEETFLNTLNN